MARKPKPPVTTPVVRNLTAKSLITGMPVLGRPMLTVVGKAPATFTVRSTKQPPAVLLNAPRFNSGQ